VFELIKAEKASFPVRMMCTALEVSRSGYYAWLRRPASKRSGEQEKLKESIHAVHRKTGGTYGSPRVTQELKSEGLSVGRHRVARLMREQGLHGLPRRRCFRVTTTTDPSLAVAPNLLARCFQTDQLDRTWASDLTYLWTEEGWLYLAAILDLCSRRIVGWSLGEDLGTELPLRALQMALGHRSAAQLHHSDRGCQYASKAYRAELAHHGIECSMSRRGNCWDNAPVESFFSTLKRELADRSHWQTRTQARADVFDYIEVFYNRQRRHSALNYQSPSAFEAQLRAA
jgi:putative transposase